jgi:hypothetical protein
MRGRFDVPFAAKFGEAGWSEGSRSGYGGLSRPLSAVLDLTAARPMTQAFTKWSASTEGGRRRPAPDRSPFDRGVA